MGDMKDLTAGPVLRHIVSMAAPVMAFLLVQALYFLVDLYFVGPLGDVAIAGVGMGGNVLLVSTSLLQVLNVGSAALIAQAVGRNDQSDASLIFNQSLILSAWGGVLILVAGYALAAQYVHSLTTDAATAAEGIEYLYWFIPALGLQFSMVAVSAALRGTGIVQPMMVVFALSVVVNIALAPILISGWITGYPMGVAGAGLATSLANLLAAVVLWAYFCRSNRYVFIDLRRLRPGAAHCKRILSVGLPAAGEMGLMFVYVAMTYWTIRGFGPVAQAGFGLGSRIMQMLLVPMIAISFAAVPIAGQNFGAGFGVRVRRTFHAAAILNSGLMVLVTLFLQFRPELLVGLLSEETEVVRVGAMFLQLASLGFVARGLVYACSSLFQGVGHTLPSFVSSCTSLAAFAIAAAWLADYPGFRIEHVWYLWVATAMLQAAVSFGWLQVEFRRRLWSERSW
jgi:putative MATE family efflux protein